MGTLRLGQQGHLLLQIAVPNNIYHYQNDGNIRFVQALRPTLLRRTFEWGLNTDMYLYAYRVIFVHIYVYTHIYLDINISIYIHTGNLQHVLASPCYAGAISSLRKLTCEFPVPHAIKKSIPTRIDLDSNMFQKVSTTCPYKS